MAEYDGTAAAAAAEGATARPISWRWRTPRPRRDSVIRGTRSPRGVLRLTKSFQTTTSPVIDAQGVEGDRILFDDVLNSTMQVPGSGSYELHANPSTRPIMEMAQGRAPTGSPEPAHHARRPCARAAPPCPATQIPTCVDDIPSPFHRPGRRRRKATFSVTWTRPTSDYDLEVYEDTDENGVDTGDPQIGHLRPGHHERRVDHRRRRRSAA